MGFSAWFNEYKKTIIGGVITASIIGIATYVYTNVLFPKNDITGTWTATITIKKTSYKAYKDGVSTFILHIVQMPDNVITGTGEKIKDSTADGNVIKYATVQRDYIVFKGVIQQHKLSKAIANLEITEHGFKYITTAEYKLTVLNDNNLEGTFSTTAANSSGDVKIIRND